MECRGCPAPPAAALPGGSQERVPPELRRPCALRDVARQDEQVGLLLAGQRGQRFHHRRLLGAEMRVRDLHQKAHTAALSCAAGCRCRRPREAASAGTAAGRAHGSRAARASTSPRRRRPPSGHDGPAAASAAPPCAGTRSAPHRRPRPAGPWRRAAPARSSTAYRWAAAPGRPCCRRPACRPSVVRLGPNCCQLQPVVADEERRRAHART